MLLAPTMADDRLPPAVSLTEMLNWSIQHTTPPAPGQAPFQPQMTPEEYRLWAGRLFASETDKLRGSILVPDV